MYWFEYCMCYYVFILYCIIAYTRNNNIEMPCAFEEADQMNAHFAFIYPTQRFESNSR